MVRHLRLALSVSLLAVNMSLQPNFDAGKKYVLGGSTLNALINMGLTARPLEGPGINTKVLPGQGTVVSAKVVAEFDGAFELSLSGNNILVGPGIVSSTSGAGV